MNKIILSFSALILSSHVLASTPRLENPVSYHPSAGVDETVRSECQPEAMLVKHVGNQLKRLYRTDNVLVSKGAEAPGSPVLRLQITHVLGVGGGAWSGPKAITVSAELLGNDGEIRRTKINRWSVGGMWGGFKGTCTILDRCAVSIGKDLARWVKDPAFKIKEMPAPKEGEAPPQVAAEEGGANAGERPAPAAVSSPTPEAEAAVVAPPAAEAVAAETSEPAPASGAALPAGATEGAPRAAEAPASSGGR